jgi:branched-chain amino acid transport system substrate-binding protein
VKRKIYAVMAVLIAVLMLVPVLGTACKPKPAEEIVVGFLSELTGWMAPAGLPGMQAVTVVMEMANFQVDGRPFKFVVEDTGTDPGQALDKARKLVEVDKASIIIGPIFGMTHLALASYLDKVKVPSVTIEGNWETMALDNKWTWIVGGGLKQYNYPTGVFAYEELGWRKVSVIFPEVAGGPDFLEGFKMSFTERGGQIIQEQTFPPGTADFAPYFRNVKTEADGVFMFPVGEHTFPLYKAIAETGFKMPRLEGPSELGNPQIAKAIGDVALGTKMNEGYLYNLDTPGNKEFVKAFKARWGELPGHTSGVAASSAQVVLEVLRKAGGDTSPQNLAKALGEIDMDTLRGRITMTPDRVGTMTWYDAELIKANGEYTYKILKSYRVSMKRVGDKFTYSLAK